MSKHPEQFIDFSEKVPYSLHFLWHDIQLKDLIYMGSRLIQQALNKVRPYSNTISQAAQNSDLAPYRALTSQVISNK